MSILGFQLVHCRGWLCRRISDRYEHLVGYYGWYLTRSRGWAVPQAKLAGQERRHYSHRLRGLGLGINLIG